LLPVPPHGVHAHIPDSDEAIVGRICSLAGLDVGLEKHVPELVASCVEPFVRGFVGPTMDYNADLLWAVHPGGKAILDACEKGCALSAGRSCSPAGTHLDSAPGFASFQVDGPAGPRGLEVSS